ncbi:NHLP leader peptide family RiPP precursor [Paenibacillus kobensis]|uniref:NHLP leader peptide family RiPP precursor n=1 Tax=Paenibacillus kobensis TaxID=59841 RepID=UPI000FD74FC1
MSLSSEQLQAQIIEKAWGDPVFKQQLLDNPKEAILAVFGIEIPADIQLTVVEETESSLYLVIPPAPTSGISNLKSQVAMW